MIKLKDLQVDKEYYLVDSDNFSDVVIIKFKVLKKTNTNKEDGEVHTQFLKIIDTLGDRDVKYYNQKAGEIIIEPLYHQDEERLFYDFDSDDITQYFDNAKEEQELETMILNAENYIPPEEYPDWDGDESIMYYLDHFEEYEDNDEEDEEE